MEHYFTNDPSVKSEERILNYRIGEKELTFISDNGVFSKNHVDFATDFLIKTIFHEIKGNLLDIGCGYGVIGITMACISDATKVKMIDINRRALDLARKNAIQNHVAESVEIIESDSFSSINDDEFFDMIITNPPIRAGKTVIYEMYEKSHQHLRENGRLYLVINKKHGAPSTISYLKTFFREVEIMDKKAGFHVIKCIK